jgi:hypothetical protein
MIYKLIRKIYHTSPAKLHKWIKTKIKSIFDRKSKKVGKQRMAAILDTEYFAKRDPLIQSLIERIKRGEELENVLKGFKATKFDERIVEYCYFTKWLLSQEIGLNILDVGSVLNNKLVENLLYERVCEVWFVNPQIETTSFIDNPVFYHVSHIENAFPSGNKFPLITCLSTIEHIGYDNSHYGDSTSPKYTKPENEPMISSFLTLSNLLDRGGKLLISVPYGYREVNIHPDTKQISSQVFDYQSIQDGLRALSSVNIIADIEVFETSSKGWKKVNPVTCQAKYADGCPAAKAVVIISGEKI